MRRKSPFVSGHASPTPPRPRLSGWCSPCDSPRAHETCQTRLDKGQLARCDCPQHPAKDK